MYTNMKIGRRLRYKDMKAISCELHKLSLQKKNTKQSVLVVFDTINSIKLALMFKDLKTKKKRDQNSNGDLNERSKIPPK